jgi:hypothetical protein
VTSLSLARREKWQVGERRHYCARD